jgi:two-component system NtrC family sensor kinase
MEGSAGVISIKAGQNEKGLNIEIVDNGPGFSKDLLEHGIRPFRTSRRRGTGLGLSMVQRFVKEIGGVVGLTNQPTQGACVSLYLPVGPIAGAAA